MTIDVFDVAAFILERLGSMPASKLQKLVYYCQVWGLVWDERPLFPEILEAWSWGPVCPKLYETHKGHFRLEPGMVGGMAHRISGEQQETVDAVLKFYGWRKTQWLSSLTRLEDPWRTARGTLGLTDNPGSVITHASILKYYTSIVKPQTDGIW